MTNDQGKAAAGETFSDSDAPTWSGHETDGLVSAAEPTIVVEHREGLIYLLSEAAEIEHGLMCCYLYAAYSLRTDDPALTDEQRAAVGRWKRVILDVARDEMVHLALVSNLLSAIGSAPHFVRPNFPVSGGYHPAGVVVSLAPFDKATLDHFVYLERPEGVELPDGAGFEPFHYQRGQPAGRLVPTAQDYCTVGHLYRGIRDGLAALSRRLGEKALFVGDARLQVGADLLPMQGLTKISNLTEALTAVDTIVQQGEGAHQGDNENSHYARFLQVRDEYEKLRRLDPTFAPARPVARNPVMRRPPEPAGKVWVSAEPAATLLDLANAAYALMLRALGALFSPVGAASEARPVLADLVVTSMRVMGPLAERLTRLPASDTQTACAAGLTFTMSRSIHPPLDVHALRGVAEVCRAVARGVHDYAEQGSSLAGSLPTLERIASALEELSGRATTLGSASAALAVAAPAVPTPAKVETSPAAVEVARGKSLTIYFEGKRCIHSRHCVLDTPKVFLANTPGEWIFPDEATVETLVGVAHTCPSGAIRYERVDGGPNESAPPVNVARVRENGPLAINADLALAGHGPMFRATFCRCGASKNKPFCDGSHHAASFVATGEPPTGAIDPLAVRDGALTITPRKNGPLGVRGNLEVCAGTGRVVGRVTMTNFCRCGGSKNKPFCDGTHAKNGFEADGE